MELEGVFTLKSPPEEEEPRGAGSGGGGGEMECVDVERSWLISGEDLSVWAGPEPTPPEGVLEERWE